MLIGSLRVRKIVARLLPTNKGVEFAWPLLYCRTDRETVATLEWLQNLMQKGWLQFSEISSHCKVKYVTSFLSPAAKSLFAKFNFPTNLFQTWFKNRRARWRKENRGSSSNPAVSLFDGAQHVCCFGNAPREFQLLNSSPNVPHPNSSVMPSDIGMLHAVTRRALGTDVTEHQSQTYPDPYAD